MEAAPHQLPAVVPRIFVPARDGSRTRRASEFNFPSGSSVGNTKSTATNTKSSPFISVSEKISETSPKPSQLAGLCVLVCDPINLLLVAFPFGVLAKYCSWEPTWAFVLNFIALIPLAQILGNVTEELAAGLKNETLGGLLNATFGNAVEMIMTVQLVIKGELEVVKTSLLGSILSNLLLVLGMSLFAGGIMSRQGQDKPIVQKFSAQSASANMSLLFLATGSLALPGIYYDDLQNMVGVEKSELAQMEIQVSRWLSLISLSCYIAFLVFQLYTHASLFAEEDSDEDEPAAISPWLALLMLALVTVVVAFSSELLVDSIEDVTKDWNIGKAFIGMILLPIVGNACEHFSAIKFALKDKLDITIGIAVGSATQIALLVVPFSVLVGYAADQGMDLNFGGLNTTIMASSVILAFSILQDGSGNWLEGWMLMAAYATVAALYWFFPDGEEKE